MRQCPPTKAFGPLGSLCDEHSSPMVLQVGFWALSPRPLPPRATGPMSRTTLFMAAFLLLMFRSRSGASMSSQLIARGGLVTTRPCVMIR